MYPSLLLLIVVSLNSLNSRDLRVLRNVSFDVRIRSLSKNRSIFTLLPKEGSDYL